MYRFIESLSFQEVREMFDDDLLLYRDFLCACVNMVSEKMDEMKQSIAEHNFAQLSALRHSIKPTLQSFELHALNEALAALSEADSNWPAEAGELLPAMAELKRLLQVEMEQ